MSPYRGEPSAEVACPRCRKVLPPLDVAACACGTWISAFAASEVLAPDELEADATTAWWKVYAPCPLCGDKMTLRGHDDGHFQGCDGHGFWIDADAIAYTGLARGIPHAALARKRDDPDQLDAHREARAHAERERARRREDKVYREAALDARFHTERRAREQQAEARAAFVREAAAGEATLDLRGLGRKLQRLERENAELKEQVRDLERRVGELEEDRAAR